MAARAGSAGAKPPDAAVPTPRPLRAEVDREREALAALVAREGEDGLALGRAHAALLDRLFDGAFARARAAVKGPAVCGLAAVGSYGRGAVALRSDADIRILVARAGRERASATALAEAVLYPLWDAGLSIGHQVMDADDAVDLAREDLATATTLLDLRHVAGDDALAKDLQARAWGGLFAEGALGDLIARFEEEVSGRHERFGGSVYLLEPDVKSGAGGLRDLDVVRWTGRARFRAGDWLELVRLGVLVAREAQEIAAAEELLWRVRNRLHLHAGRKSDRLTFDEQETIAAEMGYGKAAEGAERLMQDYYNCARIVTRARERILDRARPVKKRARPTEVDVGGGVKLFDGQVTIAATELAGDPALALRLYAACVRHAAPVLPFARDAVARAAADPAWCTALRASPEAARLFVDLVCTVPEVKTRRGSMAGELHDAGLLLAMIPEFLPVTGRVHHDVYHVYTVDVHSVAAVDCLRALARGELAHEHATASRLAAEIAQPRPLFLATLLHDVGKGYPDATGSRKNHSQSGAELCEVILPRLGLGPEDVDEAKSLVRAHLAMYHVATRRDLDDPATIEEFCRGVRGREGLRDLYLLTVADITTTSPTAMTSWKARMLEELYHAADEHLAGRSSDVDVERTSRVLVAARTSWSGPSGVFDEFVRTMPERYVLANSPEAIAEHARVASTLAAEGGVVAAAIRSERHGDVVELCVVADDRPGLLARLAAAISASRLEVLAAQVYSRTVAGKTQAVDLFWVKGRSGEVGEVERAMPRLVRDLEELCAGDANPAELLRARLGSASPWRERPSPAVTTEVVIDDRVSPRHTVIEVFAKDRPGLLYTLAEALHGLGLSIALSKINTEGTKVADVFYVSELDGSKVAPGDRFKEIRDALTRALVEGGTT